MDKQLLDEYSGLFLNEYNQTYEGLFLHPEDGRDNKINESFESINNDLNNLDYMLTYVGTSVNDLLTNTVNRLNEIKKSIIAEKERYQDIQMLCNKYTDFDNVKALTDVKFTGNGKIKDGIFQATEKSIKKNTLNIIDIFGNGYEGNRYVYNNYEYQQDVYDTSIRANMIDNKISTYYEYSRITVQNVQTEEIPYFNKDNEYARCTITFKASDRVNYIDISTEDIGIMVTNISCSLDGVQYEDIKLPEKLSINNKLDSYNNYGYVYGSGLIAVPNCLYFKLTLQATSNKGDVIAYEKTLIENEEEVVQDNSTPITTTNTVTINSARRSAIKLNDISVYNKKYNTKTIMKSEELITSPSYSIGFFANVYIPESLSQDKSVKFMLTVNGIDYDVIPMNSHSNGTKIIRFSGGKSNTAYTELINEKITSAYLTIIMQGTSELTPFVNNIKILTGGEI